MGSGKVYPNPTLKQVIFQIRFPNLFYLESKIGDLQLKVMPQFPDSRMSHRRSVVFGDLAPNVSPAEVAEKIEGEPWTKVWEFRSQKNVILNVMTNSLDISSEHHTTYDIGDQDRFKDTIKFVVDSFRSVANVPVFSRIGLRYINECPMPEDRDNDSFKTYYNSALPLHRFTLSDAQEMGVVVLVKKGEYSMRYREQLQSEGDEWRLILDFDAFARMVPAVDYLSVTDELHRIVSSEFHSTIKDPVYDYMSQGGEES